MDLSELAKTLDYSSRLLQTIRENDEQYTKYDSDSKLLEIILYEKVNEIYKKRYEAAE